MENDKYKNLVNHYEDCFKKHGDSHLGVDWPKIEDVGKRYQVMLDLVNKKKHTTESVTLLDFGCGLAHMYNFIKKNNYDNIIYSGLDISKSFVDASKLKFPELQFLQYDILKEADKIPVFDYIVMNGVFTEKRELSFDEMFSYFQELITAVFAKCKVGVAFNVMSKAVDWERDDLFHLSMDTLMTFLSKNLSRNVVIRNDYGLFEYTVYIYK